MKCLASAQVKLISIHNTGELHLALWRSMYLRLREGPLSWKCQGAQVSSKVSLSIHIIYVKYKG